VVKTATGHGSLVSLWLLEGTGLTSLRFDAAGLEGCLGHDSSIHDPRQRW
jgi:hypothetical protein